MKNNEKGFISNFELTTNIGFNNIGHTCYMNSFLQILLHIPNFLPKLKENFSNNTEKNSLIFNLIKLSEYPSNTKYLYEIKKIMGKIDSKYGEFIQGDTQSFATDFINNRRH
jgi:ubiquitin C-terminal hydrolase